MFETEPDRRESAVDLSGRGVIVTGAGSGIGRAIAETFARSGADVMVQDISAKGAEETVALIAAAGGKAFAHIADISDETAAGGIVDEAARRWGKVDVVVNNAGIMDRMEFLEDVKTDLWNRVFAVNVNGPFFVLRKALPLMRAAGAGAIVNIASEAGIRGGCAGGAYTASKHAVVGLTRSVAWTHADEGIRCNAICPGPIATNISDGRPPEEIFDLKGLQRYGKMMGLLTRNAGPQAIANAALFLASDAAYFVNGVIMPVDGGWSAA